MKSIYWNSLKAEIELEVLRCAALENLDEIAINGCDQEFLEWDRESDYQQLQHQINAFCNYEAQARMIYNYVIYHRLFCHQRMEYKSCN
ncbi:hypothetical protein AYY20_12845 [Photobacterium aquimaris]|uniref:hypothetical protein n=1 Tax=Photobacterium aquimaris TaxID=512643 RepID=UPI0007EFCBA5|nr:hypothetical protein [Photobacterium aquimaris]OBU22073.1 hypothetical protein AYY20_12845 [Photobacterium aquimaris]